MICSVFASRVRVADGVLGVVVVSCFASCVVVVYLPGLPHDEEKKRLKSSHDETRWGVSILGVICAYRWFFRRMSGISGSVCTSTRAGRKG